MSTSGRMHFKALRHSLDSKTSFHFQPIYLILHHKLFVLFCVAHVLDVKKLYIDNIPWWEMIADHVVDQRLFFELMSFLYVHNHYVTGYKSIFQSKLYRSIAIF